MEINITIPGDPKTQQRHRTFKRGTFTGTYDPSANDKKDLLLLAYDKRPEQPLLGPLSLTLKLYYSRPKIHYRTGKRSNELREDCPMFHISTPDIDNCYKLVSDGLASVFYRNDSQICMLQVIKFYSENPRTEILIETL